MLSFVVLAWHDFSGLRRNRIEVETVLRLLRDNLQKRTLPAPLLEAIIPYGDAQIRGEWRLVETGIVVIPIAHSARIRHDHGADRHIRQVAGVEGPQRYETFLRIMVVGCGRSASVCSDGADAIAETECQAVTVGE